MSTGIQTIAIWMEAIYQLKARSWGTDTSSTKSWAQVPSDRSSDAVICPIMDELWRLSFASREIMRLKMPGQSLGY